MDFLTSPLHVSDSNDLETIESLLHDESFDLDGVCFDEEVGEVTIPVRIQFHSRPERLIHKGLFFNTYEKEWEHSLVTIRGVRSFKVLKDQGINSYTFNSWSHSGEILEVECNEAMVLILTVDKCDVEVSDIGFSGKARIKRGLGGLLESSTSKVYE